MNYRRVEFKDLEGKLILTVNYEIDVVTINTDDGSEFFIESDEGLLKIFAAPYSPKGWKQDTNPETGTRLFTRNADNVKVVFSHEDEKLFEGVDLLKMLNWLADRETVEG